MLLTIRLIKSFEYKTVKNIIITVNESIKTEELMEIVRQEQQKLKVYKDLNLDTFKIYFKKFGTKSQNLVINLQGQDLVLGKTLEEQGVENETEISFFNLQDFEKYKEHPELK